METSELSSEMLEDLKIEAANLIEKLGIDSANVHLSQNLTQGLDSEALASVFRVVHSLKGLAMMARMGDIEKVLHLFEDLLAKMKSGHSVDFDAFFDVFLDLQGVLELAFFHLPESPLPPHASNIEKIMSTVLQLASDSQTTPENPPLNDPGPENRTKARYAGESGPVVVKVDQSQWRKWKNREEPLFALITDDTSASLESFQGSELGISLGAVGEILSFQAMVSKVMLVFATDLPLELLNQLGTFEIFPLKKTDGLVAINGQFSVMLGEEEGASQSPHHTPDPTQAATHVNPKPQPSPHESHTGSAGSPSIAFEDFDGKNKNHTELPDLDPEMLQDFLINADELIEAINQSMLQLETDPSNDEAIESIFRSAHTIKGTAGMFGLHAIERVTHECENIFDRVRKKSIKVTSHLMDGLFGAFDVVKQCFENLKRGKSAEIKINDCLHRLKMSAAGLPPTTPSEVPVLASSPSTSHQGSPITSSPSPNPSASKFSPKSEGAPGKDHNQNPPPAAPSAAQPEGAATIRVDLKRLDSLVNLVGELVIDRTRFSRIEEELRNENANSELCHRMTESVILFSRHMNEVQSIIMKVRMVPVGNALYKFTRVVRDLSRQLNKEMDLIIEGGETELDKTLVEEIADPLVHLVRNSVDHGIELPADRIAKGKPGKGTIRLRAYQDGNVIVISVSDDGKGLQIEKIRKKAITQGLIKESEAISNKEIFNLIFEPGFSTADQVTNISGRGVGMDVVKKNIVKLRGLIELDSEVDKGTTVTIKLPLTLAIIPSLMIDVCGENYAIPIVNVIESIRIDPKEIQKIGRANFVKLRDQVLPLVDLAGVFKLNTLEDRVWYKENQASTVGAEQNLQAQKRTQKQRVIFVVVGVGEKRVGIVVNQLQGQQEIVIKNLGSLIGRQKGIAGACVLGNGRVALVLDIGEVIDSFSISRFQMSRAA
jgi:two-component system chemotaxis sensor kinase CheA